MDAYTPDLPKQSVSTSGTACAAAGPALGAVAGAVAVSTAKICTYTPNIDNAVYLLLIRHCNY